MAHTAHDQMRETAWTPAKRLDAFAWGLFFIWVGVAFLANVGWGFGILGVGVIALGTQMARKYLALPIERFWVVMGIVFSAWGGFQLLDIQLRDWSIPGGATPIVFIAVGIVLVTFALLRKR